MSRCILYTVNYSKFIACSFPLHADSFGSGAARVSVIIAAKQTVMKARDLVLGTLNQFEVLVQGILVEIWIKARLEGFRFCFLNILPFS